MTLEEEDWRFVRLSFFDARFPIPSLAARRRLHNDRMSPAAPLSILFQSDISNDFLCPVCNQALRAPVRTPCGHFYCTECFAPPRKCEVCGENVETLERDKQKQREVQQLLVFCSFRENGCPWGGQLKELQAHVVNCDKRLEQCPSCGKTFGSDKEFMEHVATCTVIPCDYCGALIKSAAIQQHLQRCGKVIISCPFLCGVVDIPREEVEKHIDKCPNATTICPFRDLGCKYIGDKEGVQRHLREEPVRHLVLMCDEATIIKRKFEIAEEDLGGVLGRHASLCRKTAVCERLYGAQLVWKIDNVLTKSNEAKSTTKPIIYSQAFVSGRFGYKLVASCALFGDGPSRGEYMAVYVTIIRGEFDAVLDWPFQMLVRFTLLDQNPIISERVNVTYLLDSRRLGDRSAQCVGRPVGGRNAAFGAQRFCPLDKMQDFVKEDTLFLRVDIEHPVKPIPKQKNFRGAMVIDETDE